MKKNIYRMVLLTVLMTSTLSCSDDFLELTPRDKELEGNAYMTEEDAFSAVVAIYDALAVQNWNFVPFQSDVFSDDMFVGGEPGGGFPQFQEQERGIVSVENGAALDLWNRCYSGIYRANFYIYKEPEIEWTNEGNRKRLMAEARLLRAYFYWDLVRHYGWVPIIREFIEDPEDYKALPQATPQEVYQYIGEEIVAAMADLPNELLPSEIGRVSKDVARMLLGRIYLYREGFAKSVLPGVTGDWTAGSTVIDRTYVAAQMDSIILSGRYSLPPYEEVFNWANDNGPESIFEWQYSDITAHGDWNNIWGVDGFFAAQWYGPRFKPGGDVELVTGWSFGPITWSLENEFEAGDPRRDVTIFETDPNTYNLGYQNTDMFAYKYAGRIEYVTGNGSPEMNHPRNYIDMRLAEAYLIGAELALTTDNGKATDYLNEVRTRAMGPGAAKGSVTLDDIYHERRVEFAGEGQRKWDLLRRGLDYAKTMIDASFNVPDDINNSGEFVNRTFNVDTWGMLPIPAQEIRMMNPGVMQQYVPAYK